ncbi:Cytochrome P450 [Moelleriella libera RCEF 2490]|uniref:Cytochrome P450 n=1 Tax=Moelleriella libera RCEF 2490 TaxID=1081109 RepID=A0A168EFD3_9HYPO|nr:Cytochrome P450 [Moelleriella libera RCEF 2490]
MGLSWRHLTLVSVAVYVVIAYGHSKAALLRALAALALSNLFLKGLWSIFVWPHLVSPIRHLPQPDGGHWILGQGKRLAGNLPAAPCREWIDELRHDGLIRYLGFFNRERVLVCSPDALKEVLVTKSHDFEKSASTRAILGNVLGNGLLLADGDDHTMQRKNLMPAFHVRHIKALYPVFWEKAFELVQAMTAAAAASSSSTVDVHSWASRCTLDIIGVAGMGVDFGAIQNENSRLAKIYRQIFDSDASARQMLILSMMLPAWSLQYLPTKRNRDLRRAAKVLRQVSMDLIQRRRRELASNEEQKYLDIIYVALKGGYFTDTELVDHIMTFLAAGHDTTASALTWTIYQLSRHPEVQKKLRKEIRDNLDPLEAGSGVSSALIDKLPYLNAVCSEVLRTHSPVPLTLRTVARDTVIQGQAIPKGTTIMLAAWGTNLDCKLWGPDAKDFRPERWLSSPTGGADSNYALLTFLHGPRGCIGTTFSRAELACLVAACVGRFDFSLADKALMDEAKLTYKPSVILKPAHGLDIVIKVIEGW